MTRKELINHVAETLSISTVRVSLVDRDSNHVDVYAYDIYICTRAVEQRECHICGTDAHVLQYGLCPVCASPVCE